MAEKYVDLNATGAGNGLNPTDAWTTLALAEAGAIAGDNVNVAAGTYAENDVVSVKQLTWIASGVVVIQTAGTSWIFLHTSNDLVDWSGFDWDAQSNKSPSVFRLNTAGNNARIADGSILNMPDNANIYSTENAATTGVEFDNITATLNSPTESVFNLSANNGFIVRNSTITGIAKDLALMTTDPNLEIINNTITLVAELTSTFISSNTNTGKAHVLDNNITVSGGTQTVINFNRCADAIVDGNTIDSTGIAADHLTILIRSTDTGLYPNAAVTNNTVFNNSSAGQVILVGTDDPSIGDNSLDDAVISYNLVTGAGSVGGLHGIEMGYNIGDVEYNEVRTCVYGVVMKGISDYLGREGCRFNLIKNCYGSASVRLKGYKNCPVVGNTVYVNDNGQTPNGLIHSTVNTESANSPSSMDLHNQIIMSTSTTVGRMVDIDTGSASNNAIGGNLYYAPNNLVTFRLGTTSYSNLTDWNTAITGTDFEGDPLFVDPDNGNFELQVGSAAIGIGFKYWGNDPRPVSANGEPLPDVQIDAGMNQSLHSINHPGNPNFVPL